MLITQSAKDIDLSSFLSLGRRVSLSGGGMRAARINRRIQAFAIHAHGRIFQGDYGQLFRTLAAIEKSERIVRFSTITVAISDIREIDGKYFLTFTEGEEGLQPLILDIVTGETRDEELGRDEVLVSAAHALVQPEKRRILVEYVRGGAKAETMAATIEALLVRKFDRDIRIEFAPVIEENFVKEIERFKRIRVASLTLIRPNAGWDDHYTNISELLQKSDGEKAQLSVRAARGQSLNKNDGIVEVIKDAANDGQPYLADAEVVGIKNGEETETSVPLHMHVVHRNVNVPREANGGVNVLRLREKMLALLGALF